MKSYGVCVQHLKKKRQLPIERVVRSSASVHDGVAVLEGLWSEACILFGAAHSIVACTRALIPNIHTRLRQTPMISVWIAFRLCTLMSCTCVHVEVAIVVYLCVRVRVCYAMPV